MLSGVPNFVYTIGYTNASWTLKADLVCDVRRAAAGPPGRSAAPAASYRCGTRSVGERPFMDFTSGYVLRALDRLPRQGDRAPWMLKQNYLTDLRTIRRGPDRRRGADRLARGPHRMRGLTRRRVVPRRPLARRCTMGFDDKAKNKGEDLKGGQGGRGAVTGDETSRTRARATRPSPPAQAGRREASRTPPATSRTASRSSRCRHDWCTGRPFPAPARHCVPSCALRPPRAPARQPGAPTRDRRVTQQSARGCERWGPVSYAGKAARPVLPRACSPAPSPDRTSPFLW